MRITFEAKDLRDLITQLEYFLVDLVTRKGDHDAPVDLDRIETATKKRKGRPKLKKPEPEVEPETEEEYKPEEIPDVSGEMEVPVEESIPEVQLFPDTKQRILELITQGGHPKGVDVAKEILSKMGYRRFRDLPEEKYEEFYAACQDALK